MCTQPNVIEALREAEAALDLAIRRILKRDPGHHVEVTSEAKALVSVRQALQCQGCDVPKDGVYQISEPMPADKRALMLSVTASEPFKSQLKECAARIAELESQLAAAQQGVPVLNVSQATIDFLKDSLQDCDDSARDVAIARDIEKILLAATRPATQGLDAQSKAASDVLAERARQIDKGYDAQHDDVHDDQSIAAAAAVFIMPEECRDWDATSSTYGNTFAEALLPCDWGAPEFGNDRRTQLVKGAAMAIAEIERLDRAAAQAKQGGASNG